MNESQIKEILQRYLDAEIAILDGKSVTFNGQSMTMENLSEIRKGRKEWENRLADLQAGGNSRLRYRLARFP